MSRGAKPKYNDDMLRAAVEYVHGGYLDLEQLIPSGEGLALHLGVSRKTLFNWRDRYDEFAVVMEHMNCKQAMTCLNKGLGGQFNPVITKQVLARHGYHDKVDSDMTSAGKPITKIEIVGISDDSAD